MTTRLSTVHGENRNDIMSTINLITIMNENYANTVQLNVVKWTKTLKHDENVLYYLLVFKIPFTPIFQKENKLLNYHKVLWVHDLTQMMMTEFVKEYLLHGWNRPSGCVRIICEGCPQEMIPTSLHPGKTYNQKVRWERNVLKTEQKAT